jgi:type IV pilus assembly protein PilF
LRYILKCLLLGICLSLLVSCQSTTAREDAPKDQAKDMDSSPPRPKSDIAKINAQLGMAYLEQKDVQRAKTKLLMALKQGPDVPEPWYSMAYFLEATGDKVEARKYYQKAIEVAPKRGDAHNNYGTFLCRDGHYQESINQFMQAVTAPDYLDTAAAYENAGLCSLQTKKYDQAKSFFKQALQKDPARSVPLLKLAAIEAKQGHVVKAKEWLTQYQLVSSPTAESAQLAKQLGMS